MKKISIIIISIAISLSLLCTSCIEVFAKEIKGNGKLVTKSVSIANFSKVDIGTYVKVNYSQEKNTGKLEFTVDENLWEYYDIYTKGNVLYIKLKKEYKSNFNLHPTKSLITVSSEELTSIDIAGSSSFNFCTAFISEKLEIDLAGSGKIVAEKYPVNIEDCDIEIAGSGNVQLAGTIQYADIDIAGSGDVKALDCKFSQLKVDIAGSGDVYAHVADKLTVDIAGSGSVKFKGNPEIKTDITGSGKVIKL